MPTPRAKTPAEEVLRGPIKSKTVFPVLVLHFFADGPEHGYGLMQRIDAICGDLIAVNTNTIYPLLAPARRARLHRGEWDHPTKRSRRHLPHHAGRPRAARANQGQHAAVSRHLAVRRAVASNRSARRELYRRS